MCECVIGTRIYGSFDSFGKKGADREKITQIRKIETVHNVVCISKSIYDDEIREKLNENHI